MTGYERMKPLIEETVVNRCGVLTYPKELGASDPLTMLVEGTASPLHTKAQTTHIYKSSCVTFKQFKPKPYFIKTY